MTWSDAAERVLKQVRRPLEYHDLTNKILQQKLVTTKSKAPEAACYASLAVEINRFEEKGIQPRFVIERGEVRLSAWDVTEANTALIDGAAAQREKVREECLKRLRQLSGAEFESYVETLLIKMGYQNVQLRGGPGDEGIDLFCEMSQGINQVKTAVQTKCKQRQNKVGPKDVRYLRDVLSKYKCSQGVLITTASFTKDARDAANEEGKLPIILIDGDKLTELAIEHEVGVKSQAIKTYYIDEDLKFFRRRPPRVSNPQPTPVIQ